MITLGILSRKAATVGFSDNFAGTNGQLLSARSGWSLLAGRNRLQVQGNVLRTDNGNAEYAIYTRGPASDAGTIQNIRASLYEYASLLAFGSGSASAFYGYVAQYVPQAVFDEDYNVTGYNNYIYLYKYTGQALTQNGRGILLLSENYSYTTSFQILNALLYVNRSGPGSTLIQVQNTSTNEILLNYSDNAAQSSLPAGSRGLMVYNDSGPNFYAFDNYSDDGLSE